MLTDIRGKVLVLTHGDKMSEIIRRSFSSGEITPSLYARVDHVKYTTGLRTCRNFIVKRHGGAQNRPGTTFVAEVNDSSKTVRLIPFVFDVEQTYILEFGNLYMRVIRNGAQVLANTQNIAAATNAVPVALTVPGLFGVSVGSEVFITGVGGMEELNNRNFKIASIVGPVVTLNEMDGTPLDGTNFGIYTSGGTMNQIYEIITPYVEADLMDLRYTQSADVITIVHPNYAPRDLARTGHSSWALSTISFVPAISAPTSLATNHPGGAPLNGYFVTALTAFGEESVASVSATTNTIGTALLPVLLTWTPVAGSNGYNLYRKFLAAGGLVGEGYIGSAATTAAFQDDGLSAADFERSYPINDNPFGSSDNYPSAVTYYQGRLIFANTNNFTETVWMSHSGSFKNFAIPFPSVPSSRVIFTMAGRQVNSIQHMIDIGRLIVFTTSGEWAIQGNDAGIVTPTDINPLQHSYNGTGSLPPIVANGNALYVQARGTVVRDLLFTVDIGGYSGNDLSLFSSHLFDDFTLVDWAYQKIPDSIVYAVRSDGTVLGLTYIREQEIFGWHRHDFQGETVERVMSIPEGNEDTVYFVIKRTIDGKVVRYIEKFNSRKFDDVRDVVIMDSSLTFDGRNYGVTTMALSGGTTWAYDETLTLTHSSGFFISSDVGNQIQLTDSAGNIIRFTIEGYTSSTVVTGKPHKTVPTTLRNTAVTTWALAVDELSGLWHIEGKTVSVLGDGFVVGSPNNPQHTTFTVTNGTITLDKPFAVIHAGLPITADIETLNIDILGSETMANKKKDITEVGVYTEESRGLWAGERPPSDDTVDQIENLSEFRSRNSESQELPPSLKTEVDFVNIKGRWNKGGRVFLRQIDPIPATIIAIIPGGYMPIRG